MNLDLGHLHNAFKLARENGWVEKNPVPAERRHSGYHISRPFSADELALWEDRARREALVAEPFPSTQEWLPFWLLRFTGLRPDDATTLIWREVSLQRNVIEHVCRKNARTAPANAKVTLPVFEDLLLALEAERERRKPSPSEPILVHPSTGRAFTYVQLWGHMRHLATRAGVSDANPYRFRGTYAVDMLLRTNNPYYVAKLLGDSMSTVVRHYMPYVHELQEHARFLIESEAGLQQFVTRASQT